MSQRKVAPRKHSLWGCLLVPRNKYPNCCAVSARMQRARPVLSHPPHRLPTRCQDPGPTRTPGGVSGYPKHSGGGLAFSGIPYSSFQTRWRRVVGHFVHGFRWVTQMSSDSPQRAASDTQNWKTQLRPEVTIQAFPSTYCVQEVSVMEKDRTLT